MRPRIFRPVGFYTQIKITNPIIVKPKRAIQNRKRLSKSLEFVRDQLEFCIANLLKKSGDGFFEESFLITKDLKTFFEEKYSLNERWHNGEGILAELKVLTKIRIQPCLDPVSVKDFEVRLASKRPAKYWSATKKSKQRKFFNFIM